MSCARVHSLFLTPVIRYGSTCDLVLAVKGQGVHGFSLDSHVGEFILTKPYMSIPKVSCIPLAGLHVFALCLPAQPCPVVLLALPILSWVCD